MWTVLATREFDEWYGEASDGLQAKVIGKVELLRYSGPLLQRPHADTLKGSRHSNMKELRVDTSDAVVRIAYAFDPERHAILLCAGNKTGIGKRQFYTRLIDRADDLWDEHLAEIRERKKKES